MGGRETPNSYRFLELSAKVLEVSQVTELARHVFICWVTPFTHRMVLPKERLFKFLLNWAITFPFVPKSNVQILILTNQA